MVRRRRLDRRRPVAGATVALSTHDADLPIDVEHRMRDGVMA